MTEKLTTIGFDADDTLWENEQFFRMTQERFAALLSDYADPEHLSERLLEAERRNLGTYGFGIKGFVLSMIETALEVADDNVPTQVVREILDAGHDMLGHPIQLLPDARETIEDLAQEYRLVLITKGDLLDQERKLAQSGLGEHFHGVEILSDKTPGAYEKIFTRHGNGPAASMMVGNSMRSDVLPALQAGSWGVFVPHDLTWSLEHAAAPADTERYRTIPRLADLRALVDGL